MNSRWINCNNSHLRFTDDLMVAFSLWKNTKSLISLERDQSDIGPIHGIRFINAILLVISHKTMAIFFNPHVNRTTMIEVSVIAAIGTGTLSSDDWNWFLSIDFFAGIGSIYFGDWTCRSIVYGCISSVQRIADILFNHWPIATKTIATVVSRIHWPIHAHRADIWCIDTLLHVHIANNWVRTTVEFGRQSTCWKLQTVLVAKFTLHS